MDPLMYSLEVDVVGEVVLTIILLAIFVERALAPLFEWRVFIEKANEKGIKEPIAFATSFFVVVWYDFDAMAIMFKLETSNWVGWLITAGIIAGGSKGSIKLFRDFLGWKSSAQKLKEGVSQQG